MVTICLLRHGETSFNADGNRYCGRTDVELTEKGISQAKRMYELLEGYDFDAVYSSPLQRAKKTAEIASGRVKNVLVDDRLIEVDFGEWEGMRPEEFQAKDPESWDNWLAAPERFPAGRTGETAMQVISRLQSFYDDLIARYSDKTILVVGHNGVNRLFLASQLGMPLKNYRRLVQDNSALTLLTLTHHRGCQLLKLNA
ncbi:histidine phosphatase family protein [Sphingobacterium sp. SGR-19]|jgi:broad specificity phosphatase PhoE|uniref:histidine phosphatase family protein n=1 Tax=Sphingobacterium sp. SGR-19 TaxID=2710886 RepID=UPI0013EC0CDA|nr:histidine phosphatase family protein [Sphingobacterium sp. SGR-19]NGM66668.1 histidine phosphatase family protein [Sphingobacterium sp. SGR-19]HLT89243.1 histidine phosphatase family protein [Sphingobacterium sp.]